MLCSDNRHLFKIQHLVCLQQKLSFLESPLLWGIDHLRKFKTFMIYLNDLEAMREREREEVKVMNTELSKTQNYTKITLVRT